MRSKLKLIALATASLAALVLGGCASPNPENVSVYSAHSVGSSAQGQIVRVIGIERIKLEMQNDNGGTKQAIFGAGAAIVGGVLGNSIGKGNGREIARVLGAVGGAVVGAAAASQKELRDGYLVTFEYVREGRLVKENVKQYATGPMPRIGDEAMLFRGGNAGDRITVL